MKFLVDAQLPRRLARLLKESGHDVTPTLELPHRNATLDGVLRSLCAREERVLVTKDSDFVSGFTSERKLSFHSLGCRSATSSL